jgi:hypothetical protein
MIIKVFPNLLKPGFVCLRAFGVCHGEPEKLGERSRTLEGEDIAGQDGDHKEHGLM